MTALLLTIPLVAAAPVPKDFQKPAPKLDGAWKLTGMELNGQPLETSLDQIWRFDSDRLVIGTGTGYTSPKQAILTDPDASPARDSAHEPAAVTGTDPATVPG